MMPRERRERLLDLAQRLLGSVESPALARFLAHWPARGAARPPGAPAAGCIALPVLEWLPRIAGRTRAFAADFVGGLSECAASLDWRQTYTREDADPAFLRNYGWTELLTSEAGAGAMKLSCGVLVLGPNTLYPPHFHEAEELYVPLHGLAEWQQGDRIWRLRSPGNVIHHSSEEPHAMRTGDDPLLAMYLWLSADLRQRAQLAQRSTA